MSILYGVGFPLFSVTQIISTRFEMLCSDMRTVTDGQTNVTNLTVCFFFSVAL